MTSHSRIFYEAYVVETGEAVVRPDGSILEPASYEDAACEALLEETWRLQAIQDVEFETREVLAAALASTKCAVRFVRAERLTNRPEIKFIGDFGSPQFENGWSNRA